MNKQLAFSPFPSEHVPENRDSSWLGLHAECQHCHFAIEARAEDDQSGFEFRCSEHERTSPGHIIRTHVE